MNVTVRSCKLLWVMAAAILLFLVGCTPVFYTPPPANSCTTSADCPGAQVCKAKKCQNPAAAEVVAERDASSDDDEPTADKDESATDAGEPTVDGKDGGTADEPTPDEVVPEPECKDGDKRECPYSGPKESKGVGPCKAGSQICEKGRWSKCIGEVLPKEKESCNGEDDNCDGKVDEDLSRKCYNGKAGTEGKGACREGSQICENGIWGSCKGEVQPEQEICDGKDNDCDGEVDEGCSCTNGAKQACGADEGECKKGQQTCSGGKWGACSGEVKPATEVCDGKDNNCDGYTDENLTRDCYGGPSNTAGKGECTKGKQTCSSGSWGVCLGEVKPTSESCDGKDNDCDGSVDESLSRSCYNGPSGTAGKGICKNGSQSCKAGVWQSCVGEVKPASKETCDGKDNDCDGTVDEGCNCKDGSTRACGSDTGECKKGTQTCTSGNWGSCTGEVKGSKEVCDTKDNDCDGKVDEDSVCKPNLVVSAISMTVGNSPYASGKTGFDSEVSFTLTVSNTGKGDAPSNNFKISYRSSLSSSTYTTYFSGVFPALKAGQKLSQTYKFKLQSYVTTGKHYLYAFMDVDNKIAEDNETDNSSYKDFDVTALPDIRVTSLVSPSSVFPGSKYTVSYRVTNYGAAAIISVPITNGLYFSTDFLITTADTLLAQSIPTISLRARGSTGSYSVIGTIPTTAKVGARYYLGILLDTKNVVKEVSETNNYAGKAISILSKAPDLAFKSGRITFPSTTRLVGSGTQFTVEYDVINSGNSTAPLSYIYFYYSDSVSKKNYRLGSASVPSLAAGKSTGTVKRTYSLPSSVFYGTRYITFELDASKVVSESNESNNLNNQKFTVTGLPDYTTSSTAIYKQQTSYNGGNTMSVDLYIINAGQASGDKATKAEIFYSSSSTFSSTNSTLVYTRSLGFLRTGARLRTTVSFKVPGKSILSTRTRTYYLHVFVNRADGMKEFSTRNNQKILSFQRVVY